MKKWSILRELVAVLKIPYNTTIDFQSKNLTLSDVYGKWLGMQIHLGKCTKNKSYKTGFAQDMLNCMQQRNEKIFSNPLMSSALYLDPRFNCQIIKFADKTAQAKQTLLNIWNRQQLNRQDDPIQNNTSTISTESLSFEFDMDAELTGIIIIIF